MLDRSKLTDQEAIILEYALTNLRLEVFDYQTGRQENKDQLLATINTLRQACDIGFLQEASEIKHLLS